MDDPTGADGLPANSPQALLFLTHRASPRIFAHFQRLQRETDGLLECFLCVDRSRMSAPVISGLPAHLEVSREAASRVLPLRCERLGRKRIRGFEDTLFVPLMETLPSRYEFIWVLEYDLDFSGPWSEFFCHAVQSRADLIGAYVASRARFPDWVHWAGFVSPPEAGTELHHSAFLPLTRFSRPMLSAYKAAVGDPRWDGHYEALVPTIAKFHGLAVEDLVELGPSPTKRWSQPQSFAWGPVVSDAYWAEEPARFPTQGSLYHPVKVPDAQRPPQRNIAARLLQWVR